MSCSEYENTSKALSNLLLQLHNDKHFREFSFSWKLFTTKTQSHLVSHATKKWILKRARKICSISQIMISSKIIRIYNKKRLLEFGFYAFIVNKRWHVEGEIVKISCLLNKKFMTASLKLFKENWRWFFCSWKIMECTTQKAINLFSAQICLEHLISWR